MKGKLLLGALALVPALVLTAHASGGGEAVFEEVEGLAAPVSASAAELPCQSAILAELTTGQVLFEKNADERRAPASITKVMDFLLIMEALEDGSLTLEETVVCSDHASSMGGSQIWLEPGEEMTVHELLKAMATVSANDAAVALGEHLAGSEEAFADKMNRRAAELGMTGTHFVNASGLDDPDHYTTARDIVTMSRELARHPKIFEYTTLWMDSLRNGETQLVNTNRLIRFYPGATGLKTGTTEAAGSCLAATAKRGELHLAAVVLGSRTGKECLAATRSLLDLGFGGYAAVPVPDVSEELAPVPVRGGAEEQVPLAYEAPPILLLPKSADPKVTQQIQLPPDLTAPVEQGQRVGLVEIFADGEKRGEYLLTAAETVERMTLRRALRMLWHRLCRLR